jgi:hypothetical protein
MEPDLIEFKQFSRLEPLGERATVLSSVELRVGADAPCALLEIGSRVPVGIVIGFSPREGRLTHVRCSVSTACPHSEYT